MAITEIKSQAQTKRMHLHEVFEDYLAKLGLRQTKQRKIILDAVFSAPRHVDAETVAKAAKAIDSSIGLATVYRTLKMLVDSKILVERHFSNQRTCFEFIHEDTHHDHLICNQCGEIIEFLDEEIERKQEQITRSLGFMLTSHKMELFGDCLQAKNCKRKQ